MVSETLSNVLQSDALFNSTDNNGQHVHVWIRSSELKIHKHDSVLECVQTKPKLSFVRKFGKIFVQTSRRQFASAGTPNAPSKFGRRRLGNISKEITKSTSCSPISLSKISFRLHWVVSLCPAALNPYTNTNITVAGLAHIEQNLTRNKE